MSTDTSVQEIESTPERSIDETGEPILEVSGLKKHFEESEGLFDRIFGDIDYIKAVDGVDLEIQPGETLAVVGESGCGKSTLAHTILNLHEPTDGTITFKGDDITGLSRGDMRPYRRQMQLIFQDPLSSLNPRQTVGDILRAPMEVHDIGESTEDRTERAGELLEEVGLSSSHLDRYPHQFSGGQQQRIGLARALTVEPDLLVADEPVSALDVSVQSQVLNLFSDLQDRYGLSMIFIAHDLSVVRHIADRVAVMYLGEVVETAPVDKLFNDPKHPYTKSLISAVPRIDPAKRADRVILRGSVPSPIDPPAGCRFHTRCPSIIPPDDWPGDQEAFRNAFTFRSRIEEGKIEPEAVRTRIKTRGDTSDQSVVDRIIETELPTELDRLPASTADAVEEAARHVVEDDLERAVEVITDALPSPCVDENPEFTHVGDRKTACHRINPDKNYRELL
ncbi:MAG: ABC transporter ATP-binding protein [Halobacteriales archaeon]